MKKTYKVYILWLLGFHYLYLGKWWMQFLYLITLGGCGIWFMIDFVRIPKLTKDYNDRITGSVLRSFSS